MFFLSCRYELTRKQFLEVKKRNYRRGIFSGDDLWTKRKHVRCEAFVETMSKFPGAISAGKLSNRSIDYAHFSLLRDSKKHSACPLGVHISSNL